MKRLRHYLNPRLYGPDSILLWFLRRTGHGKVVSGPFAGMAYLTGAVGSMYVPKLLGTYEKELHSIIRRVQEWGPDLIVNIGAADGYYAVGLAATAKGSPKVVAYEAEESTRAFIAELAAMNRVEERIEIAGRCEPRDLEAVLASYDGETLVLCDTEGDEFHLVDPQSVPSLRSTRILLEVHEFVRRGMTEIMLERFHATHDIDQVVSVERTRHDYPFSNWFTRLCPHRYILDAMAEHRPERMNWLWMAPKRDAAMLQR